jgi:hypothetical protein
MDVFVCVYVCLCMFVRVCVCVQVRSCCANKHGSARNTPKKRQWRKAEEATGSECLYVGLAQTVYRISIYRIYAVYDRMYTV